MPRLFLLLFICPGLTGCLRERLRANSREPVTPVTPGGPVSQKPMPAPKPPQPPPLHSEPLPPPPPELTPVAPPAIHPKPAEPTPIPAETANTPPAEGKTSGGDVAAVRTLAGAGRRRYEEIATLECHLTKREVVRGNALPQDELVYRLRAHPKSVYMKVLSEAGKGRELLYVEGANSGKIAVLTGKGDNVLVGVGYRTNLDPDSKMALSKSRYPITEAGFARTFAGLARAAAAAESGRPGGVKSLGLVNRNESAYALEGVEISLAPGSDPQLPQGGTRQIYFDPKPDSPSYQLPVLIETADHTAKQVEYYFFHDFAVPCIAPASAWDPARLGK